MVVGSVVVVVVAGGAVVVVVGAALVVVGGAVVVVVARGFGVSALSASSPSTFLIGRPRRSLKPEGSYGRPTTLLGNLPTMAGEHSHGDHHGHEHNDDHGHNHGSTGLLGRLRGLIVPHSHDASDRVDSALEASKEGMRALAISFGALFVTAIVQGVVVVLTRSVALLGDTMHNVADAMTAVPIAVAFGLGRRAANDRFTYGYGRSEDLAGIAVVVTIAASAAFAGYEAIQRLIHPATVTHLWGVGAAGAVGFVGNEVVARYRLRVGRRIGSAALVADGLHARTDGLTSLAVVVGAIGVGLGFDRADPIVGLVIAAMILVVLRSAAVEVLRRLMDAVDPLLVQQARGVVGAVDGVQRVGGVRMRWVGHALHAEAELVVDTDLSVGRGHAIAEQAHHQLLHEIPRLTSATIHVDPCGHDGRDPHEAAAHHSDHAN